MARRSKEEADTRAEGLPADRVCVAQIGGPRGVKGAFFVKPFVEDRATFRGFRVFELEPDGREIRLVIERENAKGFVVTTPGITTPEDARALAGRKLYVPRSALPELTDEDSFYHVDLVGLEARDPAGRTIGRVLAVQNFGAGNLIELALDRPLAGFGDIVLLPFERALFPEVDVAEDRLVVDLDAWVARHGEETAGRGRMRKRGPRRRPGPGRMRR